MMIRDGLKTYEISLNEIRNIEKRLGFDQVVINFNKLDPKTREDLVNSLSVVLARRESAVISTITGAGVATNG